MKLKQFLSRRWMWFVLGLAAVLVATGVTVGALTGSFDTTAHQAAAHPFVAEEIPAPDPSRAPDQPTPRADIPVVVIESTKPMPYTAVWNPPDGGQDFWQVVDPANGYPESGGTDYVLAHACADRDCVGNELRALAVGDTLSYLGDDYVVEEKLEIEKTRIAEQDIWHHDADRVVLITCIINPDTGGWDENDIIVANRKM